MPSTETNSMSKNLLQTITCVLLTITFNNSFAQQINSPLLCAKTTDEVGCLLNLAKSKAMVEKNIATRSEAFSSLLKTHSNLRRSDYELLSHASNLLKNKKLAVESFLELEVAIASYLAQFQTEKSQEKIDKAVAVFLQAIKNSKNEEKIKLYTWACGLVDLNSTVWKLTIEFVTNTCLPEEIKKIQSNNQIEDLLISVLVMHSSWVQSDYIEMQSAIEESESSIARIEAVGIKGKHKELNALTQNMKVLISLPM